MEYLPKIKRTPIIEKLKLERSIEEVYAVFAQDKDSALLNSSMETDAGRYSYIGIDPISVIRSKKDAIEIQTEKQNTKISGDPLSILDNILSSSHIDNPTDLPFVGGGIGYLSYDLKNLIEDLPERAYDDLVLPDLYFVFYRTLLVYDREDPEHITAIILDIEDNKYIRAEEVIKGLKERLSSPVAPGHQASGVSSDRKMPASNFTKEAYVSAIEKSLEHIRAGDIYQLCLSHRFNATLDIKPYELYRRLNKINPAPFSSYINLGDASVISSSPELYLKVADGEVETRPMKGTRPRGKSDKQDTALREELERSEKDSAELVMIVDLERNDLGRISVPGSVKVEEHRRIETYPTVFQTIARITGKVQPGTSMTDIIKATFPGGSITGCPKIRAMQIIDKLEPTARSVYCGAIGYISLHQTMQLNIAIRTMIMKGNEVFFQVGSGIVADSDPEAEYQETLDKAKAMLEALESA